jgi:putative endonuclease
LRAGAAGEAVAIAHLEASGLGVIVRDWRCRLGQLGAVCEEAGVLVAVAVKARSGGGFGLSQEAVNRREQATLRMLFDVFRLTSGRGDQPCRIDVVTVHLDRHLRSLRCEHIRDAAWGRGS